jgi:hypothetical protein
MISWIPCHVGTKANAATDTVARVVSLEGTFPPSVIDLTLGLSSDSMLWQNGKGSGIILGAAMCVR